MKRLIFFIVMMFSLVAIASTSATVQVIEPKEWKTDPKSKKTAPPKVRAEIRNAAEGLTAKAFSLEIEDKKGNLLVLSPEENGVADFTSGGDPAAVVFLIQGDEYWMGNETYHEPEDDTDEPDIGGFTGVKSSLPSILEILPEGSVAGLVTFGEKVKKVDSSEKLSADALGAQKDYKGQNAVEFVGGLDEAISLLQKHGDKRRILIIMGDGTDKRGDVAQELSDRRGKLKRSEVEVFGILFKAEGNQGAESLKRLAYTGFRRASSKDDLPRITKEFANSINATYYVTFPGIHEESKRFLPFDGEEHVAKIVIGKKELELDVKLTKWSPPKKAKKFKWWLWIPLAIIALIAIAVFATRNTLGKSAVAPPPPPPEPPAAAHTMMMGVGGSDDGFPIVGWIVPLEGAQKFQTFKLMQGATVIGTSPPSQVVVMDQYMSTEHAEIVCSPAGFILNDKNSTNGTFVNDKQIESHELVDNDVFVLGGTRFKFKSIN